MLHSDFQPLFSALGKVNTLVTMSLQKDVFPNAISPDYLRQAVRQYPLAQGKRMRPALVMWLCGLLGKDPMLALHGALSVELYHNWTLIHDDIIDQDILRRGAPTIHAGVAAWAKEIGKNEKEAHEMGLSTAILAGDIVHGWAVEQLTRLQKMGIAPHVVLSMVSHMQNQLNCDLISGEAIDVDFSYTPIENIHSESILKMFEGKTSALLIFCATLAVAIAKNDDHLPDPDHTALCEFANALGIAFQLQDDLLGIYGDESELGKSIGLDLQTGKATYLMADALAHLQGDSKKALLNLIHKPLNTPLLREAQILIEESGAKSRTETLAQRYIENAKKILYTYPASEFRTNLLFLCDYAILRKK